MSRKQGKSRPRAILIVLGILVCLVGFVLFAYAGVQPVAALEYGGELSPALFTERTAALAEGYETVSLEKGRHVLFLQVQGRPVKIPVLVDVSDTTAPLAEPRRDLIVPLGETLTPDRFFDSIRDNDKVQIYFGGDADFAAVGAHTVPIVLEDMTGNKREYVCEYRVRGVREELTAEAGGALPEAAAFLICDAKSTGAELASAYTESLMHHVGTYNVIFRFSAGNRIQEDVAHLIVVDTVPPAGTGVSVVVLPGQSVTPERFVKDPFDATDLRFDFAAAPDMDCHDPQQITVRLTDEGGNATDILSTAVITTLPPVTLEARRQPPTGSDFGIAEDARIASFDHALPGTYLVKVWLDGQEGAAMVTVVDSTAPAIEPKAVEALYRCHPLTPEELFAVEDVSETELAFLTEPDWSQAGEQTIAVAAVDAYGNRSTCTVSLTLLADTEPPQLFGAVDRHIYRDENVAYLAGVHAEDAVDGAVEVTVSTAVDIHQEGAYRVTYRATDLCGNETSAVCTFTVIAPTVTDEEIRTLARGVMAEITTPDMVNAEKLKAIYWYVRDHVRYANGINKNYSDWRKAAHDGFVSGRGDCYNIWAVTKALLDETDIEYESVERVKSPQRRTRHYWVNVNLGNGWYVFDPTWTPLHKFECFMWTEAQCNSCRKYWLFDKTKHHPLATEHFDYDFVVLAEKSGQLP